MKQKLVLEYGANKLWHLPDSDTYMAENRDGLTDYPSLYLGDILALWNNPYNFPRGFRERVTHYLAKHCEIKNGTMVTRKEK